MNELIHIGNADISIKEYKGQRVVTFKDIDMVHERPDGTAKRNFNTNKARFVEGEDYFIVSADEIRTSRMFPISDKDFMSKALITEQGYLMLVKSFTDDLAWEVQRKLVSSYFNVHQSVNNQLSKSGCDYSNCKHCKDFLIRWFKKNLLTRRETDRSPRHRKQHRKPLRQLNISKKQ